MAKKTNTNHGVFHPYSFESNRPLESLVCTWFLSLIEWLIEIWCLDFVSSHKQIKLSSMLVKRNTDNDECISKSLHGMISVAENLNCLGETERFLSMSFGRFWNWMKAISSLHLSAIALSLSDGVFRNEIALYPLLLTLLLLTFPSPSK